MRPATWCLALWAILALAVFADLFDWKSRQAGFTFVRAQVERRQRGVAPDSIENGFRPLVRRAALDAALWSLPIVIFGTGATLVAGRAPAR